MRQSDCGLDLLGAIVDTKLRETDFTTFNVADALAVIRTDILEGIKQANCGCPPEQMAFYINENFPQKFTQGALLIAECLADCYRTGELIVTEYVGEKYDPVDHHIKEFVVSGTDCQNARTVQHHS